MTHPSGRAGSKRSFDLTIPNPRNGDDEINIIVRCEEVDNGIGAYEYWGAKGTHHQWELEWELESSPIPDEEIYADEKLCETIQTRCEELWDEGDDGLADWEYERKRDREIEAEWERIEKERRE